jgi:hypothetical protein
VRQIRCWRGLGFDLAARVMAHFIDDIDPG